jgi:glycosyltransferase involved in cell wall biosynthesis
MKKVLIITYYWPPSGGAGVQRWLKFAKYLPESGWEPIILTVDPVFAAYPVTDDSLTNELPLSLKVHKTQAIDYFSIYKKDKTKIPSAGFANSVNNTLKGKILRFIRGNFFIPDPRRGWNKYAFIKACEIIRTEGIKHVITTSPPHSTQLIGLRLKKKYPSLKWIADLRDPWTDIYYYRQFYPTFISKLIDRRYEMQVLRVSDGIISVGKSLKDLFSVKYPEAAEKIEIITNGYDEDDFTGLLPLDPDIFTISYIGTLSDAYPIEGFLNALHIFKENGNEFRLRFIGTISANQKELILSFPECAFTEFINYVDHHTALNYMAESTMLLLIIPDHPSNKSIITGKLFEYIASGKPIICLGPADGDAAEIIRITGCTATFGYYNSNEIQYFISEHKKKKENRISPAIGQFSRRELTAKLIAFINRED